MAGTLKICPRCGKEFSCSAGTGECWCFRETFPAGTLAKISEAFPGKCICKNCLRELCEEERKSRNPSD